MELELYVRNSAFDIGVEELTSYILAKDHGRKQLKYEGNSGEAHTRDHDGKTNRKK